LVAGAIQWPVTATADTCPSSFPTPAKIIIAPGTASITRKGMTKSPA